MSARNHTSVANHQLYSPVEESEQARQTGVVPPVPGPAGTSCALWLHSPANRPRLRVGLLLDGPLLARFCAKIIEQIQSSNFASLDLVVYRKNASQVVKKKASLLTRLRRRLLNAKLRKHALYDLYLRLDNSRMRPRNHPRDLVDCSGLLSTVESMVVEPLEKGAVQRFPAPAVEQVRAMNLDVLIRFGFKIIRGEILSAARYGIWSYHHGDNDFYRGAPPHFWELYERNPFSGVILQVLNEELDAGMVLCKSLFTTRPTVSVSQNEYVPYWGTTDLIIRKLNELHQFGWEHVQKRAVPPAPYQGKRRLYRVPTNFEMVRWLVPQMVRKAVERPFRKATVQHWRIGIRYNAEPLHSRKSDGSLQGFRWLESPQGHFWADPFLIEEGGGRWVFFEDYVYAEKRAGISCAAIAGDGSLLPWTRCLEGTDRHYSYPYVFRDGKEIFMVPESESSRTVDLYRCEEFPGKWQRQATLLRGKYVDPAIWHHEGLWWLTVTTADPDARCSALYLFYAEKLAGPWMMHPANPISTDVRWNRGAGSMLWSEGRLIRPSQSCCPIYGYSFSLNEVTRLSPSEYEEQALRECKPDGLGVQGVHTYNWIPGVEVIDGVKRVPLRSALAGK